jgi:uncharacterized Fe-S center protein
MTAKVYFTNMRTKPGMGMLEKLQELAKAAGLNSIPMEKKFVAVKIHFGEPGNLAFIRPNYAAKIVGMLKANKALPFLTDCNTLYKGRRDNAVSHLDAAMENGFTPSTVGCHVIIADGVKGTEQVEVPINLKHCKTAKIGASIASADIVITLNHFKGHEMTSFGGALKNIGMGCGSVAGKLEMHSTSQPKISAKSCIGCQVCFHNCNHGAISMVSPPAEHKAKHVAQIDYAKCVGCGQCVAVCRYDAARVVWDANGALVDEKIAEYSVAVLQNKPALHINFVMNVSPECDCWSTNDAAIIPDLGILASTDPVALDRACIDLVNKAPTLSASVLGEKQKSPSEDKLNCLHPHTNWRIILDYAQQLGLGEQDYELIPIACVGQ